MNPVSKALWSIEHQLGSETSLTGIANASGVPRYQLLRTSGTATADP